MPGLFDRIKDTTQYSGLLSVGTSFAVDNAPSPVYQSFRSRYAINDGNIPVAVVSQTSNNWTVCWCTYTAVDTLRVDQIIFTSNTTTPDDPVTFSGASDVFVTASSRAVPGLREQNILTAANFFLSSNASGDFPVTVRNSSQSAVTTKYIGLRFQGVDTVGATKYAGSVYAQPEDSNYVASSLRFATRTSDAVNDRMTILGNGNVGIGTTTPDKTLVVNGGVKAIGWGAATAGNLFFGSGEQAQIYGDANVMAFYTAGSERVRIDNAGRLGVGLSSPSGDIHTYSASSFRPQINADHAGTTAASAGYLILDRSRGSLATRAAVTSGDYLGTLMFRGHDGTGFQNSSWIFGAVDGAVSTGIVPSALIFTTTPAAGGATERLRITSAGTVGVNTTNPATLFHIQETSQFSLGLTTRTSSPQTAILNHPVALFENSNVTAGNGLGIRFRIADTSGTLQVAGGIGAIAEAKDASSVSGGLYFYTGSSERMRITNTGNVGIATTAPDQPLVVGGAIQSGTTGNNGNLFLGGINVSLRSAYSSNVLGIYTSNLERIRVDSNGLVGVNTTTLSKRFTVEIGSTLDGIRVVSTGSGSGANAIFEGIGYRSDGNTTFETRFAGAYRRSDGTAIASGARLGALLFGGQWGVDTTLTTAKVLYAASIIGIAEGSFTAANAMATGISFRTGSTGDDAYSANLNYGTERMRITNTGNVGINVSPSARLDVQTGATSFAGTALSSTFRANAGALGTAITNEVVAGSIGFVTGNSVVLGVRGFRHTDLGTDWQTTSLCLSMDVDSTPRAGASIWLAHNRNVGIGPSNTIPAVRFHVQTDGTDEVARFEVTTAHNPYVSLYRQNIRQGYWYSNANTSLVELAAESSKGLLLGTNGSFPIVFSTANTQRGHLSGTGNLLIGATTAVAAIERMEVAGGRVSSRFDATNFPAIRGTFYHAGNAGGLEITAQGANNSTAGSGVIRFLTPTADSANASTDAAVTERVRIGQSGILGIGISAFPVNTTSRLYVSNDVTLFGSNRFIGWNLDYSGATPNWTYTANGYAFALRENNGGKLQLYTAANNTGGLGAVASPGVLMTFDATATAPGNVGIGNSSPVSRLHVEDSNSTGVGLFVKNASTAQNFMGGIGLGNSATANGFNVTIGTAVSDADTTDSYFAINKTSITTNTFVATLAYHDLTDNFWAFHTAGSERVRIGQTGILGIGISAFPVNTTSRLYVSNDVTLFGSNRFIGWNLDYSGATPNWTYTANGYAFALRENNGGKLQLYTAANNTGGLGAVASPGVLMTFDATATAPGNVGIGTSSPSRRLEVTETGTNIPMRVGNAQGNFDFGGSDGVNVYIDSRTWGTGFQVGGTTRAVINTSGNVGVGDTSPFCRLHVRSDVTGAAPATSGTTDAATIDRIHNNVVALDTGVMANGNIWLQGRNTGNFATSYPILINPNPGAGITGALGFGTTAPRSIVHFATASAGQYFLFQNTSGAGGTALTSTDTYPITSGNGFIGYGGLFLLPGRWGNATTVDSHNVLYLSGAQRNTAAISSDVVFANWGYFTGTTTAAGHLGNATAQADAVKFNIRHTDNGGEFNQHLTFLARSASGTTVNALRLFSTGEVVISDVAQTDANSVGYRGAPLVSVSDADRTFAATDAGKTVIRTASAAARTWTVPSNASVPFPNGTCIIIDNSVATTNGHTITLANTNVTFRSGTGGTLAASPVVATRGVAVIRKVDTNTWVVTGSVT